MEHFPAVLSRDESDALASAIEQHVSDHGFGLWAVEIPGVAPFAGYVGLAIPRFQTAFMPAFMPAVEIGWRLAYPYWGFGYATEVDQLAGRLEGAPTEHVGGWTFWRGTLNGCAVIVAKTLKGMTNAAAATAIAVEHYHPVAIINQGTAGGHDPALHVYDIVLG